MRAEGGYRPLLGTLGSAAVGIAIGIGVLAIGYLVSRTTLAETSALAAPGTPSAPASPIRTIVPVIVPTTAPPTPTPRATPPPSPTPDPIQVTAFEGQGLRLAAITVPTGYTVRSPIAGTVRIVLYQFLDGEIREGANVTTAPTYPYLFVTGADRELKIRPAALDRDVELLVRDGQTVEAGAPLPRTRTTAPSSWRTFYDARVTAQIVASAIARPAGTEVDPVPLFRP